MTAIAGHGRPARALLPLQMLFVANGFYFVLFFFLELALIVYKDLSKSSKTKGENVLIFIAVALTLPYPSSALGGEIFLIFILVPIEMLRLFFGNHGNLRESIKVLLFALLISIASLFGALYLLIWETYVLRADVILSSIQIILIGLEIIFGFIAIIIFAKDETY